MLYKDAGANYWYKGNAYIVRRVNEDNNVFLISTRSSIDPSVNVDYNILAAKVQNTFFIFNFETTNCSLISIIDNTLADHYPKSKYGANLMATELNSIFPYKDYVLMDITSTSIPLDAKYYRLGWNRSNDYASYAPFVSIGHNQVYNNPNYEVLSKTIVFENLETNLGEHFTITPTSGNIGADFSGAPVLDINHRVIGTYSGVGNSGLRYAYGFGSMYDNDLTVKTIIGNNSTIQYLDGMYCIENKTLTYSSPIYSSLTLKADEDIYISSKIYSGTTTTKATNSITLQPNFAVAAGASFVASLDPCH
jgi:hypothetical protein